MLDVIIERKQYAVAQYPEIHADILLFRGFPQQWPWHARAGSISGVKGSVKYGLERIELIECGIGTDCLAARISPSGAQFQIGYEPNIAEEVFA